MPTMAQRRKLKNDEKDKNQLKKATALIDTTLDVPEHVEGIRHFRLVLNAATLRQSEKIANALVVSRRLPFNPEAISISDPLALYITSVNPKMKGSAAVREAEGHYDLFLRRAQLDAMIVAMTAYNKLPNTEPLPYEDEQAQETEEWGEEGVPDWVEAIPPIPQPNRDLDNPYESRLKIVMDFLEICGIQFTFQFNRVINDDLAAKLKEMGVEEQDDAGFPTKPNLSTIPASDVSESLDS